MAFLRKKFSVSLALFLVILTQQAVAQLPDFTSIIEDASNSVVNISTTQRVNSNALRFPGHPFDFLPFPNPPQQGQRPRTVTSLGSGFIINTDGYILTNAHVVNNVDEINVKLPDGEEVKAVLIGADTQTDIALIKIETNQKLQPAKIGDSDLIKIGQWAIAIGSPFGFEKTITAGIISALNRQLPRENYVPFIQTDTAINRGNSGGPLLNDKGEVIGINSQIFSRSGDFAGLSFAIPINIAMDIQKILRVDGVVRRGHLGVYFSPVDKQTADAFGMEKPEGALVNDVLPDSAAQRAGIEPGDVILKFGDSEIESANQLPRVVGNTKPNTELDVVLWRNGEKITVQAKIGEFEVEAAKGPQSMLGLIVRDLNEKEKESADIEGGVMVVDHDSDQQEIPEGSLSLKKGDIIIGIVVNGTLTPTNSVSEFRKALSKRVGKSTVAVRIKRRNSSPFFISIDPN